MTTATTSLWEWQEIARKAEAVGFDTLIAQDHFGKQFAPLPSLVAAGAVTVRLRLATVVLDNDFRHPAALAKEAATVDVLTSGRLELGLGAGWLQSDYAKTGLPFDPPAERLERLAEAVQICKLFFTAADGTDLASRASTTGWRNSTPRRGRRRSPAADHDWRPSAADAVAGRARGGYCWHFTARSARPRPARAAELRRKSGLGARRGW